MSLLLSRLDLQDLRLEATSLLTCTYWIVVFIVAVVALLCIHVSVSLQMLSTFLSVNLVILFAFESFLNGYSSCLKIRFVTESK